MALYGASVLALACGAGGLGFCLPTMATTDAMHKRVAEFAGKALRGDAALTRVHSMAWLSTDTAADSAAAAAAADRVVTDSEASVEASRWLHSNRRGLLAPLSTFTIDQGLTGVLPMKYNVDVDCRPGHRVICWLDTTSLALVVALDDAVLRGAARAGGAWIGRGLADGLGSGHRPARRADGPRPGR